MSEKPPPTPGDIARQLAQHLDSLRGAGIEWVPSAPLPEVRPVAPPPTLATPAPRSLTLPTVAPAPSAEPALQTSLFAVAAPNSDAPLGDLEQREKALAELRRQVSA